MARRTWFDKVRKRLRKWLKKPKSPKAGAFELFVRMLLMALRFAVLAHQLASVLL